MFWTGRFNIVKMSVVSKLICRVKDIGIRIPASVFFIIQVCGILPNMFPAPIEMIMWFHPLSC